MKNDEPKLSKNFENLLLDAGVNALGGKINSLGKKVKKGI